jgi:hypothetical protein
MEWVWVRIGVLFACLVGIIASGLGRLGGRVLPLAVLTGGAVFGGIQTPVLKVINLRYR